MANQKFPLNNRDADLPVARYLTNQKNRILDTKPYFRLFFTHILNRNQTYICWSRCNSIYPAFVYSVPDTRYLYVVALAPRFHLKLQLCDYYILNCLCLLSVSAFSLGAWRLCSGRLDKMWGFECLEATCIVCYHWANPIGHRFTSKQMLVYSNRREVLLENFRI